MVTTVTLSPCIDLMVRVPALAAGQLNLASATRTDVAGKGVNVSVVLRALGQATLCTGITFDGNGQQLDDYLEQQTISRRFATAHGNIRTNIKVYDDTTGEMTEINHLCDPVDAVAVTDYLQRMAECAAQSSIMVFSGRVPAGVAPDIYRRSLQAIAHLPVKVIVDAEGEPLRQALLEKPYLIKPNTYELETAFDCKISSPEDAVTVCRQKIIGQGAQVVCVSLGGDGAVIVDENQAFYAPPLDIVVEGFSGAGDSMVAGLCKGMLEGLGIDGMLRYGVAAASASLLRPGTQLCRRADFDRLLPLVTVQALVAPSNSNAKRK